MKFYIAYTEGAEVIDCTDTQAAAVKIARQEGPGAYVDRLTIIDPRRALRLMLGHHGGYADDQETVYRCKRGSRNG